VVELEIGPAKTSKKTKKHGTKIALTPGAQQTMSNFLNNVMADAKMQTGMATTSNLILSTNLAAWKSTA
jgi:hypothetical protein